ncbi:unnamed protein product [Mortierella alpina]
METLQLSSTPGSSSTDEIILQVMELDEGDLSWLNYISMHPAEQDRLRRLTTQVVVQFLHSNRRRETPIAEVGLLASVLDCQDYRSVLSSLIERFDKGIILNLELLQGLVFFLQSASPGYLIDDDLVSILRILRKRLGSTHTQVEPSQPSQHTHLLVTAVSRVLDTMVENKVNGLRREEDHEPLLEILAGLMDSPDPYLKHQATYAWQALQYVGDEEPPLQMAVRVGGRLVTAGLGVASAFKLDIGGLFDGLRVLVEAAGQALNFTKAVAKNTLTARDAGAGVVDSLLEGFRAGVKRAWYPALQGARVFIREGRLAEFERVVHDAPCCHEQNFQLGVCQLLGEIALDPIWSTQICQQAVCFLEDLDSDESGWISDSSVRGAIRGILQSISEKAEILIHVNSPSKVSGRENGDYDDEPYPLITRLSIAKSSPLLAKAHKATPLEDKVGRILAQQREAYEPQVYIPPNARATPLVSYDKLLASIDNPLAHEDECSPLMDMVMEFIQSKRQVFLILGDSGSGKSTFNKHLSYVLTRDYKQDGPIPLFIDLPTAKDPQKGLVPESLKTLGFSDDEIQELKQVRHFVLICDAYDETRLSVNLHTSNMLNRHGEWQVHMIISCRSSNAGTDYKDLFQPQPESRYVRPKPHLFQEAVIVAFSASQIEDYVKQFVRDDEVDELFPNRPVWSAEDYMDRLRKIANLLELATNPFLLSISLRLLPTIFKDGLDASAAPTSITESKLIDIFIQEWLEVNRKRVVFMKQFEGAQPELEELVHEGFIETGIEFLRDLAAAMLSKQGGRYVVQYKHKDHKHTWKANFFGPDEKVTLLREASPLVKVKDFHSFLHRSLYEYFVGLYMRSGASKKQQTHPIQEHSTSETSIRKSNSCPHRTATGTGSAAGVASGTNHVATGALMKVDGVRKRTVQVVTTRKAKVDHVCPIAKAAYVYYDDEVYDSVLTEKSTGITYVTQLIFDSETKVYYVYYRWGETDYNLDGPHETIESAKEAFQLNYMDKFDVEWKERETTISDKWVYEVKTYETLEEVEEIEEVIEETEAERIIARQKEIEVYDTKITEETTTTVTKGEVTLEHFTKETEEQEEPTKRVIIGVITVASNPKFAITIDGDGTHDGTRILIQEKKAYNEKQKWNYLGGGGSNPASPSPSRAESISIRPGNFPTSWFYIKSAASNLVVDIEHGYFTDPMKAGARAEMNHQKIDNGDGRHSLLELQLWRYEAGFLINRRTGFVLDIQGSVLKATARVVQWQRKSGKDARNQHWFYENGFIANVNNSRLVMDIDGDGFRDGTKIAIGERKAAVNNDQKWLLEEARFTWLETPSTSVIEETALCELPASVTTTTTTTSTTTFPTTTVLPTAGWFYIKSRSSGYVIDVEQGLLTDSMAPNVLVNMNAQVMTNAEEQRDKLESQLWRYSDGQLINRRSGLVLDCKQGVVRYGAGLMQGVPKQGKEAHHQRWETKDGNLIIQGKPLFAIDIEGDELHARLSLQRPKAENNSDQQWIFQLAFFEFLQHDRIITRTVTEHISKVVTIKNDDWFFIKSGATGFVMDLEDGWITSPTDPGAYISMKKQRSLNDPDKSLLERQLWRYEDGYFINRRTNYVIDIYGRSAVVGVKLIQQHKATTEEDGKHNQLWNVVEGNMQLVYNPKLVITAESNKDNSRVQLVELKSTQSGVKTWTLELASAAWLKHSRMAIRSSSYDEGLEEAQITSHTEFPSEKYFYIKSRASGLVLDVEHGFLRDHTKPGSCVELNNQKLYASTKIHALLELQLWCYKDCYIINRRTGLVLDVYQGCLKAGSRIIQWSQKSESNENQLWAVSNGFIHLKSQPNLVLNVDSDGTRDGARIALNERKDKKNLDQRWTFEAVQFTWLTIQRSYSVEDDVELLKEFEANNLARVVEHRHAPVNCWFYLKSGISDLVLEVEHGRQINHLQPGTHLHLAHQRLKSGKHSHALLELQLWRFDNSYIINRRSGLVLGVDQIEANAQLIQTTKTGADTQRWVIEEGVIRLASRRDFAIFFSYGRQGSRAYIRYVRQGEHVQSWSCAEVHFSWLTLDYTVTETLAEEEKSDASSENEISYLKKEQVVTRSLEKFSRSAYFFIRTSDGQVVDIDHGFNKNHMKVGAYASIHPQTTAASANQHAMLDIQLWTLKDGYLINKRTGLALTLEGDAKEGARLIQVLPKDAIKWAIESRFIFPEQHSHLALNVRDGYVVVVERTTAVTWSVYEVTLSWLVWTEVTLIEEELSEDFEFYEEFEEVVLRSSAASNEVIEYAETVQHLVAPKESWFYLVAGNKVASITASHILERGADGAHIHLVVQKRFSSAERHSLVELQLWRLEDSYVINRFTGLYLTVDSTGALIMTSKQADASCQQWQFSEDGSFSLISDSSRVVDFDNDKAMLVERSSSKTIWLYDAVKFNWLTASETSTSYDVTQIEREITEYKTVYKRYITYLTKYTVITTTTTITRTRRIVRVHPMCSLEKATVLEREGTVWACHLKEAVTGVDCVMQLLLDNTKNVYYIYVKWGSTEGQLEGPYETTEQATREFQEIFASKVNFEWTERETAVTSGENWSAVEFEYDTITIESERSGVAVPRRSASTTSVSAAKFVDRECPIADQATVYSDDEAEIYHVSLSRKTTGEIYITQLLFNYVEHTYYVYLRWGEDQIVLDGPYQTVEEAKVTFKTKYTEAYGVRWEERKTVTNTQWSIVHHEFGTEEEFVDYVSEEEDEAHDRFVTREQQHTTVHDQAADETTTTTTATDKVLVVNQPAVTKETSWFRRFAVGAGLAATAGALVNVDGVWKRISQVLTTRKAHVDAVCPIAKISYVYYDDEVYDSVLTEKSTGITYVTQLIYNSETNVYYVYYRWGETNYTLDGPHETIESAKEAFQVTYKEKFDVEWKEREISTSEKWVYEFKTYEEIETIEEIEEVYDESEAKVIIAREKETVVDGSKVHEHTTTTVTQEEVTVEHETTEETVVIEEEHRPATEVVVKRETGVVAQPAVSKETSWFRRIAYGAGGAAVGALTKVDGIWKRTVQVFNTRKAPVDHVCPISKHAFVYYDEDVYDSVLTEKSTGITYVTQLIFDSETKVYYVYYRWRETDYKLDGPHDTIESAKEAFQVTFKEKFDVEWKERETNTSEKWMYEVKTYETYEEIEEIEEVVDETEAQVIIARERDVTKDDTTTRSKDTTTTTTTVDGAVSVEHVSTETIVDKEKTTAELSKKDDEIKEVIVTKTTSTVTKPAVPERASWFRRVLGSSAAVGAVAAGAAAVAGAVALNKVDGVWKRTVQVLTTRKAKVDHVCPIAKTAYVYYDEDVYDSVLTEKSTGITYVTQLIFDSETNVYYVYYRWGETDYKLDGPHDTIESAKEAFQVTYKEKFDVEWKERETTTSEKWVYEVKTYETFEEIEEVEEVIEESEAEIIIAREKATEVEGTTIHEETKTTVTEEVTTVQHETKEETIIVEEETEIVKEIVTKKETGEVTKPAVSEKSSWFRRAISGAEAAAHGAGALVVGAGAIAIGVTAGAAYGAGHVASGALHKVDGVWKRTVQVLTTRKAKVDHVCPIAKTAYVYYDDEVYDSVLTEKSTGITYVTQLIFDSETKVYYVYYRWGETDYKLDGPHETIESAKEAFQVTYKEKFDVEWKERETTTSEKWVYEVKTYETFEEVEEIEEVIEETEAETIIARQKEIEVDDTKITEETTTTVTKEEVTLEHVTKETVVVEETEEHDEAVKEVIVTEKKETGVVAKPAVSEKSSWFRRAISTGAAAVAGAGAIAAGAASGAGQAASGALTKVDGVWKRTVQVLTTRKAHVDHVCPIAKTSYVYYDDEVYDSVLTEKSTGITYVTQLIFDSETKVYYVYYRWGETDYKLDGPHETIESAKEAFQVTYKEKFDVEWKERETTTSEKWVYEVKTYETFEEVEEVEEVIEETQAELIIAREKEIEVDNKTKITEETTTTVTEEVVTLEHETTEETVVIEEETETEVTEVVTKKETGEVTKPAVSEKSSWFRRALSGAEAAAHGAGALVVGAGAIAIGVTAGAAYGAGHVASGALHKVDGVWKRTVQVLTTRKAKVDHVCPIAKTAYVYYDDEVYDSVLTEKSTGITYVTQLIFDSETKVYYVYYRWGETDYKLDGPHETIESAKGAFQVTYKEKFDVEWKERETTTSDKWMYEVKTYETFEEIEEVEEVVEETEIQTIIVREHNEQTDTTDTTQTVETSKESGEVVLEHVTKELIVLAECDMECDEIQDETDVEVAHGNVTKEEDMVDADNWEDDFAEISSLQLAALEFRDQEDEISKTIRAAPRLPQLQTATVENDVHSSKVLEFTISGTPASLGDMTVERLVREMSASPVFEDQTMGIIDLAKEPDILRFLVDQVDEDPAYTKQLLWTVYKSGGEGINQSTRNAMCILKKAGIQFHLQR